METGKKSPIHHPLTQASPEEPEQLEEPKQGPLSDSPLSTSSAAAAAAAAASRRRQRPSGQDLAELLRTELLNPLLEPRSPALRFMHFTGTSAASSQSPSPSPVSAMEHFLKRPPYSLKRARRYLRPLFRPMQPPYSRFTLIRDYSVFREYVGIPFERIYVYADKVWNRGKVQQQQQPPPTPQQQQHVSPQHVSQGRSRRKGSRGKMIVHCDSASRSTCVQYRHFYKLGISYEEAFRHFRSYRDRAANRSIVTYRYMCPYLCAALEYVYAHSEGVYGDELLSGVKDASEHVRIPYSFEDVAIVEEGRGWEDESVVFDLIYLPRSADISFQLVDQRPRLQPQSLALATQANLEGGDSW